MEAGRLRHRITLEALSAVLDSDDGIVDETWADAFAQPIPAEIVALSGGELVAAQAVQSKVSGRIRMRWRPGVLPTMRVRHRDTLYNIEAVVPDPGSHREWITLLTSTGTNEG